MTNFLRLALLAVVVTAQSSAADAVPPTADALWKDKIQPLFAARCYECHGEKKAKHNLRLHTKDGILKGGSELGPVVIAKNPDQSPLLKVVQLPRGDELAMPPKGERLTKDEIAAITAWITSGAPMPDSAPIKPPASAKP